MQGTNIQRHVSTIIDGIKTWNSKERKPTQNKKQLRIEKANKLMETIENKRFNTAKKNKCNKERTNSKPKQLTD